MGGRLVSRGRLIRRASTVFLSLVAVIGLMAGPWVSAPVAAASGIDMTLPKGHSITGHVTGPGGTPIGGMEASAQNDTSSGAGISKPDGTFEIPGLPDGSYLVSFQPQSRSPYLTRWYGAPTSSPFDSTGAVPVVVSGADMPGIDQELEVGTSISGTVTGVPGVPVAGIQVNATGGQGAGSAIVAADGTYSIVGLFPGSYILYIYTVSNSPYLAGGVHDGTIVQDQFGGTSHDTSGGNLTGVDFSVVTGVSITGRVTGGDGPVEADANETLGFAFGSAVADAQGDFSINGLWPSSYTIIFVVPTAPEEDGFTSNFPYGGYADGALVDQSAVTPVDASAGDVSLTPISIPAGAAMSGTIRGGAAPLPNAFVSVCDVNEQLGCVAARTVADGTFRIGHFETGDWIVQVSGPHHVAGFYSSSGYVGDRSLATPVHIDAGGPSVAGIDVTLPAGGAIGGRISGPQGEAIVGATVFASQSGAIGPGGAGNGSCQTGSDGTYLCDGLPAGDYIVGVNPVGTDPSQPGSPYLFGYYDAAAPGHFTSSRDQLTLVTVIDPNDHTPPTVLSRLPADEATNVPRDVVVTAHFSEGVVGLTAKTFVLVDAGGNPVAAKLSYDVTGHTATLRPKSLLGTNSKYVVTLAKGVTDANGNKLAPVSWSFRTTKDGKVPTVVSMEPQSHAKGVPTSTFVRAVFSEDVRGLDETSFTVVQKSSGLGVPGTVSYDEATRTATFTAEFPDIQFDTLYQVTLKPSISDLAGNPLARTTWSFTTGSE
jgi:Bacterial Ig-like domain